MNQLLLTIIFSFFTNTVSEFSVDTPSHALHLSTFEMTINSEKEVALVRLRVFQDDFRDAIKNANPEVAAVSNEHFLAKRKVVIERYLQQHFQLIFDGKNSPVSLINSQAENDIYWLHFDLVFPKKTQNCTLQADYLMELFDDQSNIGTVILNGKKQFFRFTQRTAIFQIALSD